MVWIISILIILFYISIDICNFFNTRKISNIAFFFSGFAFLQVTLGILTLSKISVNIYIPLAITFLSTLFIISFLFLIIFTLIQKNKNNGKININLNDKYKIYFFKKSLGWFCIVGLFISTFFINHYQQDTIYYILISNNFINNGIYTATGLDGGGVANIYLIPSSYYLYALLFNGNLIMGFTLLNRLFYIISIYLLITLIIDNSKFKNEKINFVLATIITLLGVFIFIFNELKFSSSVDGNIPIQSISILISLFVALYSKKINILCYIIPVGALFFSSTALLVGIPTILAINIYWFLCYKEKIKIIQYSGIILFLIIIASIVFFGNLNNFLSSQSNLLIIYFLTILFGFGIYLFAKILPKKAPSNKGIFTNNSRLKLYLTLSLTLILPLLGIIFYWIIPIEQNANILAFYDPKIMIFPIIIGIILFYITFISFIGNRKINNLTIIIISFWIIGTGIKFFLSIPLPIFQDLNSNLSSWRLSWIFIGADENVHNLILLPIVLLTELSKLSFYKKWNQKFPTKMFKNHIIGILMTSSLIPLIIPALYFQIDQGHSNIQLNLRKISKNDIIELENLNNNSFEFSYLSFAQNYGYLKGKVDLNSIFNSNMWLSLYNPNSLEDNYSPNQFQERLNYILNLIKNDIFKSVTGKRIIKINYIFLDSRIDDMYQYVIKNNFNYSLIYEGQRILVFEDNDEQQTYLNI